MNTRNHEGYSDPTAFEALCHIRHEEKVKATAFRPIVYICSPLSGEVERNQENARKYCRFAVDRGCIPIAPHLLFPQFMDDDNPADREIAMKMNMALLSKCRELWVFGNPVSKGMAAEIQRARVKNQLIRHYTTDCEAMEECI